MSSLASINNELVSLGYKRYPHHKSEVDAFYQKTIIRDGIKDYFINIEVYDFKTGKEALRYINRIDLVASAKFYRNAEDTLGFDVSVPVANNLRQVEEFFREVFFKFNCVPDIHNND